MTKDNKIIELSDILMSIRDYTKCIVIYGSNSINSNKKKTIQSDYDFLIIFKNSALFHIASNKIEKDLFSESINFDYCWYVENYFLSLLNEGIDLHLFRSIFLEGEILYSESDFIEETISMINRHNPSEIFLESYSHRKNKIHSQMRSYARNLSRICFDYISTIYCQFNEIVEWTKIPCFESVIVESKNLELIDDSTYNMMIRLQEISKLSEQEIARAKKIIYPELLEYDEILDLKSNLLIKPQEN